MNTDRPFFNLYNHGFVRVAVGIPTVRVADPEYNARGDHCAHESGGGAQGSGGRLS